MQIKMYVNLISFKNEDYVSLNDVATGNYLTYSNLWHFCKKENISYIMVGKIKFYKFKELEPYINSLIKLADAKREMEEILKKN